MATGPEHYRIAESLMDHALRPQPEYITEEIRQRNLAMAQIHATLAVAAAIGGLQDYTGASGSFLGRDGFDTAEWMKIVNPDNSH